MSQEATPSYTCEECPYSMPCLAGKLSLHKRRGRSNVPGAFGGPDLRAPWAAHLCPDCGDFLINPPGSGRIRCALRRKETILTREEAVWKGLGFTYAVDDPSLGGGWMVVDRCEPCHKVFCAPVEEYNAADAAATRAMVEATADEREESRGVVERAIERLKALGAREGR